MFANPSPRSFENTFTPHIELHQALSRLWSLNSVLFPISFVQKILNRAKSPNSMLTPSGDSFWCFANTLRMVSLVNNNRLCSRHGTNLYVVGKAVPRDDAPHTIKVFSDAKGPNDAPGPCEHKSHRGDGHVLAPIHDGNRYARRVTLASRACP